MAISARSRRGTSASFWRNHNALQFMVTKVHHMTVQPMVPIITPITGPAPKVFIAKMQ
jgi:hypothetical protein